MEQEKDRWMERERDKWIEKGKQVGRGTYMETDGYNEIGG